MNVTGRVHVAGSFVLGLVMLIMGGPPVQAEETPPQGAVEERAVPRFPSRPPITAPAPTPSGQVMSAYRAALSQPVVRSAADAEIRRQLRTIRPIAFVNGYWITPVDISAVYSQVAVRTPLINSLRGIPGGLHNFDAVVAGRTDVALVFIPNQLADLLQIPRADLMGMIGLDALRAKAMDSYSEPPVWYDKRVYRVGIYRRGHQLDGCMVAEPPERKAAAENEG